MRLFHGSLEEKGYVMNDNVDHLNSVNCRFCAGKMAVTDSRIREISGVRFTYRRKTCQRCGERYSTAEIPLEVAEDVFGED